jgi:hypothetical protein
MNTHLSKEQLIYPNKLFYITKARLFQFVFLILSFIVFFNADDGFSYDYQYYSLYIKQISESSIVALNNSRFGLYVNLEYSTGGIEFGFVLLIKFISFFFESPETIYGICATLSLYLKSRVMFFFKIKWGWVLPILLYSIILLESNALRSGISLSFFLLSIQFFSQKKYFLIPICWLISLSLHLQAFYFVFLFFVFIIISYFDLLNKRWFLILSIIASLSSGMLISKFLQISGSDKLITYALKGSESGGFNVVSLLSLITLLWVSLLNIKNISRKALPVIDRSLYSGLVLLSLSTLSIYIFLTSVAVIGDRLWQWGFIIFCFTYFGFFQRKNFILSKWLVLSCLLVNLVNITIRYPLSNFLYPILPYINLSNSLN